jgi:hypothetical protein
MPDIWKGHSGVVATVEPNRIMTIGFETRSNWTGVELSEEEAIEMARAILKFYAAT